MKYTANNLHKEERLIYETKLHKFIIVFPSIMCFFLIMFSFIAALTSLVFSFSLIILGFGILLFPLVQYISTEYTITNKRIISKHGFIYRRSSEIRLEKIEGIELEQGIFERLLDQGTIKVTGTGGFPSKFKNIANPMEFRNQLQNELK